MDHLKKILCPQCNKKGDPWGENCRECFIKDTFLERKRQSTEEEQAFMQSMKKQCLSCMEMQHVSKFELHSTMCLDCIFCKNANFVFEKDKLGPLPFSKLEKIIWMNGKDLDGAQTYHQINLPHLSEQEFAIILKNHEDYYLESQGKYVRSLSFNPELLTFFEFALKGKATPCFIIANDLLEQAKLMTKPKEKQFLLENSLKWIELAIQRGDLNQTPFKNLILQQLTQTNT